MPVLIALSFLVFTLYQATPVNDVAIYKPAHEISTVIDNKSKDIDLYSLYYSASSNELLNNFTSSQRQLVKKEIGEFDITSFLESGVNGGLYDLWLYTHVCSLIDQNVNNKEKLINYIESLYAPEGFYLSHKDEDKKQKPDNYLLSTKMALETLALLESPSENSAQINRWLSQKVIKNFNNTSYEPISGGDTLFLIISLNQVLGKEGTLFVNIEKKSIEVIELLVKSEDSFEKFNTIMNLNSIISKKIPIDKNEIINILGRIHNNEGGFPLYGDPKQNPDILSTYLCIKMINSFNLDYPITEKDELFINNSLSGSFR